MPTKNSKIEITNKMSVGPKPNENRVAVISETATENPRSLASCISLLPLSYRPNSRYMTIEAKTIQRIVKCLELESVLMSRTELT